MIYLLELKNKIIEYLLTEYKTSSIFIQKKALYTIIAYLLISLYMTGSIVVMLRYESSSFKYTLQIISSILTMSVVFFLLKRRKLELSINILMFLGYINTFVFLFKPLALQFFVHTIIVLMIAVIVYLKPYQLYIAIASANIIIWIQVFIFKNHIIFLTGDTAFKSNISLGMIGITFSVSAVYLSRLVNDQIMTSTKQKNISITDHLTGLYKRQYLYEIVNQYIVRSNYFMVMVDLDHFKSINDHYGHKKGDDVLKAFAHSVQSFFTSSDLCFRWGGEEFLFCVNEKSMDSLLKRLDLFRMLIEGMDFDLDRKVTVSIGVCETQIDMEHPVEGFILVSDQALYRAKEMGRNRIESLPLIQN